MRLLGSKEKRLIEMLKMNALVALSVDSIWIYTLMKSGTTYLLLFLSNYLNLLYGDGSRVSYDQMQNMFFFHSLETRLKEEDLGTLIKNRRSKSPKLPSIIHSHQMIEHGLWDKNISLYRNPLDYIISYYYYFYKKRGKSISHPRKIIDERLASFIALYNYQRQFKTQYADHSLWLSYEQLMMTPFDVFSQIIKFLGFEYDENMVSKAMEYSSKDSVKQMEEERGRALVVSKRKKFTGSFVRSGKIGDWKNYFNDQDLKKVESILNHNELSLNQFVVE